MQGPKTLGFAMCGSFCTLDKAMGRLEALKERYSLLPVMSQNVYETGNKVLHTIVGTEPIGPKRMVDAMVVCPCTGNTLSKIALGITDTPVTMAVKSTLRVGLPVIICLASNDALGASGQNVGRLMNTKNVYFVPLRQDDPDKKPFSLVADFELVEAAVEAALNGRQLQPVFR